MLEKASGYERGLGRLDETQKDVVRRLWEIAGDLSKVIGKKQKSRGLYTKPHIPGGFLRNPQKSWESSGMNQE